MMMIAVLAGSCEERDSVRSSERLLLTLCFHVACDVPMEVAQSLHMIEDLQTQTPFLATLPSDTLQGGPTRTTNGHANTLLAVHSSTGQRILL